MYKKTACITRSILIGMAVGAATAIIGNNVLCSNRKAIRKSTNKVLQAVGSFVDNMDCMLRR